ncbi:MAG: SpoIIE family protein phosphatase [Vulcanimicrobiaceae bacterium]
MRNRVLEGYSELAEAIPQIVWVADVSGRIERMSQRWTEYTGMPVDEALDRGWLRALHTDDIGRLTAARRRSQATGERFDIEYRIRGVDGEYRWFLARALPIRNEAGDLDQWVGTCTEIDDQKRAERLLRFFARSGRALGASLESRKIARNLIELVVPEFADACAIFSYEGESFTLLAAQHTNATRSDAIRERFAIEPPSMNDPMIFTLFDNDEPAVLTERREDGGAEMRQVLLVPLAVDKRPCGLLRLAYGFSGREFSDDDLLVASELARRAALAFDHARRYAREHRVALRLQEALLPSSMPIVIGAQLSSLYVAAETELLVGGDWYDAFNLPSGMLGLSIGDVTGHGLDAAVIMGEIRQAIRSAALEVATPAEVLDHADRALRMQRPDALATAGYGVYDPNAGTFLYANAGHPPPFISGEGEVRAIHADGLPLGMRNIGPSNQTLSQLLPGETLLLYTDGLIEFERDAIDGEFRLKQALRSIDGRASREFARVVHDRVVRGAHHPDDTALLALVLE